MNYSEHIFNNHLLNIVNNEQQILNNTSTIWQSLLFIICLTVFVFVKNNSYNKLIRILQAAFNNQVFNQIQRDEANSFRTYSVFLLLFYNLSLALLAYKINALYSLMFINLPGFIQFIVFFTLFTVFNLLKILLFKVISFVSNQNILINEYTSYSFIINQTFSLIILPLVLLSEIVKINPLILLAPALILFFIHLLIKWLKGISFGLISGKVGILQSFIYLCAIEILPSLVLGKILIEKF
jgi:hypothetical protein